MPLDFESTGVLESGDFTMKVREKREGETQSNLTYKVASTGGRPIGSGGELGGIAKLDHSDIMRELEEAEQRKANDAMEFLRTEVGRIDGLLREEPGPDENERRLLEQERRLMQNRLEQDDRNFGFSVFQGLPRYLNNPAIRGAVDSRAAMLNQRLALNSFEPLVTEGVGSRPGGMAQLTRAVAGYQVDQLLGMNVISEEKFGVDEHGRTVGISVMVDGVGVVGDLPDGKPYFLDIDYSRHEVQKGLYDLEAMDYITGQIDRHPGNIFIDPETGAVKGIDNDLGFPDCSHEELLVEGRPREAGQKILANKPLYMHEDTARRIEALHPEALRARLQAQKYPGDGERGGLTPKEIEAAVGRLKDLQLHIRELRKTGHVVREFTAGTYEEAIRHQGDAYTTARGNQLQPGETLENSNSVRRLDGTPRTSYLGAIAIDGRKNTLGLAEDQAERLEPEALRTTMGSPGKAERSLEHVEFSRLVRESRGPFRAEMAGHQEMVTSKLNRELGRWNDRLRRLENPNWWDKFRAIWHGGVEGAKQAFEDKRLATLQKLGNKDRELEAYVDDRVEFAKEDLWNRAQERAATLRREQGLNQGVDLRRSQDVEMRVELDVERDKVEDVSLGESRVLDVELLAKLDTTPDRPGFVLNQTPGVQEDVPIRLDGPADDELMPKLDEDTGVRTEPLLQKQDSVRKLVRPDGESERGVKHEPEVGDGTSVRSKVSVGKLEDDSTKGPSVKV